MKAIFDKIWSYLSFRKGAPGEKPNFNLRTMHTINKISILMFAVGLVILILKWIF